MGRPTNMKSSGCAVTTSNCVVWQGPDLCCIDLCHGDSISEVINELAKKICKIFEMLNVQSYDLSELAGSCGPANFIEIVQLLIDEVSALKNNPTISSTGVAGCPDCELAVATCFQSQYGAVLSMTEYVVAIGKKLCDQQVLIQTQNNAIAQLTQHMSNMQQQLDILIAG